MSTILHDFYGHNNGRITWTQKYTGFMDTTFAIFMTREIHEACVREIYP